MVGYDQSAHPDGDLRNGPRQERAGEASEDRARRRDHRALPKENCADVVPPISHRAQDRDLLHLRKHRHGEDVKDGEAGEQNDERDGDRGRDAQSGEELQVTRFAILPALRAVLKERFEALRQSRRARGIAQLVDDHGGRKGSAQKRLRDPGVRVNAGGIDGADAAPGERRNGKAPVFAAGREQLNRIADR